MGYHLANELDDSELSTPSTSQHSWWKYFWNLKLPSKVKIFMWKAFHRAIPTAASLCNRKIIDSAACSLFSNAWEFVEHALFPCKHAKKVWHSAGFPLDYDVLSRMKFSDCLVLLSIVKTTSEMEQMLCTMWFLWTDRNTYIHGKPVLSSSQIWAKSAAYYCNFQQHSTIQNSPTVSTAAATQSKWILPPLNELKMNVDAACDVSCNKIGVGIIVRNSSGQVVAAYSKSLTGRYKSQEMEAKALLTGLDLAAHHNLLVNHLESDSLVLVNSINCQHTAISSFGDLVLDIKNRLSYLSSVCVSYVKRDANQAAHGLAKQALVLDNDLCGLRKFPLPFSLLL
ncbi:uncharacterized protein LOC133036862 [Cannabis sativa]|uniref:uncharacterized protein LOC133036862 n=1 Tax=Cannabis sativa TaxID=3483 RepID=UPI0029C9E0C1|nr:uncharacterized protein LOC133036862 [Cannabis sativa]